MNHSLQRSCGNKVRHRSEACAQKAVDKMRRVHGPRVVVTPYRCLHCDGWHVGHPSRSVQARMIERTGEGASP